MLAVTVMCGTVVGSYQETQAAEIVAGIGALEIIEGILLSFGISVMTSEMIGTLTKDPDAAKQEEWNEIQAAFWQDQLEAQYEAARKKKMEAPSPTPEPDDDNKDKTIPTFKELMQKYKDTGKIVLGSAAGYGVWDCMKEAVGSLWDKLMDNTPPTTDLKGNPLAADTKDLIAKVTSSCECTKYNNGYYHETIRYIYNTRGYSNIGLYYYTYVDSSGNLNATSLFMGKDTGSSISSASYYMSFYFLDINDSSKSDGFVSNSSGPSLNKANIAYATNCSYELESYVPYQVDGVYHGADAKPATKEEIWVHPDLQETYQNNGKLEYPQEAPQPLNVPSIDQLTELATKLSPDTNPSYDPSMTPEYVAELIKQLQATETPDPQPTTKPDVNPTLAPNPTGSPTGTPEDPTPEEEASPYKADLREIFPFCIPFDLIHLFKVFDAEPEAPVFKFPLDLELDNPWTGEKVVDYHHEFEFDFSDYEDLIKLLRIIQIVAFITGLMMITRQQMIKG